MLIQSTKIQAFLSESLELSPHSIGPHSVDPHSQWIHINAFSARLTALNVVESAPQVDALCNLFLEEGEVREHPVLFGLDVSAAAQHMIQSASHVYRTCEKVRTLGYPVHWQKWKEGFENSLLVTKDPKAKKYAQLAVTRMQLAKRNWNKSHRQKPNILAVQEVDQINWMAIPLSKDSTDKRFSVGRSGALKRSHNHVLFEMLAVPRAVVF